MEVATGALWQEILREEVFAPAEMRHTEYDDVWRILRGRARGYDWRNGEWRHVEYEDHGAYAAGGLLSSARDLLRFTTALQAGRIIRETSLKQMTTVRKGEYALGWQVTRILGRSLRNHTGGIDGYASHIAHYDNGQIVIVLSNNESEPAKATACNIAAILFGLAPAADLKTACRPEA